MKCFSLSVWGKGKRAEYQSSFNHIMVFNAIDMTRNCQIGTVSSLGKLVENNWSEILGGKLVDTQLAENSPQENSSQVQKIIIAKY